MQYIILSPEGFASILYKDSSKSKEAAEHMKLTSYDLKKLNIIDEIIKEPKNGAQEDFEKVAESLKKCIKEEFKKLLKEEPYNLIEKRYKKYRKIGQDL